MLSKDLCLLMTVILLDTFILILSFLLSPRQKKKKKINVYVIWKYFQIVNLFKMQKPIVILKSIHVVLDWIFVMIFFSDILCSMIFKRYILAMSFRS